MNTKQKIIEQTKKMIAQESFNGFSVRKLSQQTKFSPSHLYYYTKDTEQLFKLVFDATSKQLGEKRAQLPKVKNASEMLKQRIEFQFTNAEDVVYILKYYTTFRSKFKKNELGYVPQTAYKHISEVLEFAQQSCEWDITDKTKQAKTITHAINGFVLEYYPNIPSGQEREELVKDIHQFVTSALKNR
jgi:AcrR family transcriptional regulator